MSNIDNLSLFQQKELFNRLLIMFGIKKYELSNLSIKGGKVVKFYRSYGPYDDEYHELSINKQKNVIEKFRLMVDLNKKIEVGDQNYYLNLNNTIDRLASKYSEDDLRMD